MKTAAVILSVLSALVFAVLCGFAAWREYGLWVIAVGAAMIVSLPLSSLIHELGHMLFGAFFKIKAVPRFRLFGSSSCKLIPKTDAGLRSRLFFTAIGGVLLNMTVALIVLVAVRFLNAPVWLTFIIPSNIYLCILNVIPAQFASDATDGLVCNQLLNNTDEAKVMLAVLTVQAQVLNGKPIGDIEERLLFGVPQIREDDINFIALTELRYEYFKDKGDGEQANKYLARLEELKKEYM